MAYLIPSDIPQAMLKAGERAELRLLDRLRRELPPDYSVYHSVHWSHYARGRMNYGEVDFVIINRAGDLLLIEMKTGEMEESAEGLVKRYADGHARNAAEQVRASVDAFKAQFGFRFGRERRLAIDYLLYLPDHRLRSLQTPAVDPTRVVDAARAEGIIAIIRDILPPGTPDEPWRRKVCDFLDGRFEVVPDIHAHRQAGEACFLRLNDELGRVIDNIEMQPLRLRVIGTAGCGKSLLAARRFRRARAEGRRPLLLCFNRPLADRLAASLEGEGEGMVETWHGFCRRFLEARGLAFDFTRASEPGFWRCMVEMMLEEMVPDDWRFDPIIVDEGQDFEQDWYELLGLFAHGAADILWLEDPAQRLYGTPPVDLPGFIGYRASGNYRTPESIARVIQRALPRFSFEARSAVPGMGVHLHRYDDPAEQPRIVASIITDLLAMGFPAADIAVLTTRGLATSALSGLEAVGEHPLIRFTGEYTPDGRPVWSEGRILFDTVRRFKGQQAPAVILVDVGPQEHRRDLEDRLLFCGMTRATLRLHLVVNRRNPQVRRLATS